MKLKGITTASVKNKKVLVRVDFNVPLKNGRITSDKRIKEAMNTLDNLFIRGAKQLILISHLGRPKGNFDNKYSLKPVAKKLQTLMKEKVQFIDDCIDIKDRIKPPVEARIVLLENLRFYPEEKNNNSKFAKQIASVADVYVNDAFGTSHRKHASVHAITKYLPSMAGLLLESELKNLNLSNAKKPLVVLLGGAKVSDKIGVIKNLIKKADAVLLGGAMIFTFYKAMGLETGKSLVENEKIKVAKSLMKNSSKKIMLPSDIIGCSKMNPDKKSRIKHYVIEEHPKNMCGLDIGPETVEIYKQILSKAKTVIWNGPMGMFEIKPFDKGTNEIAKFLSKSKSKVIIGGGDSVSAIEKLKLSDKIDHISTGGGASLELLEGKELPAVSVLKK